MILGIPSLMVARGKPVPDTSYWDDYVRLGSNFVTTSRTLVNITGLSLSVLTPGLYEIESVLKGQGNDTSGFQFSVACDAFGATGEFICMSHTATIAGAVRIESAALGNANGSNKITTANADGICVLKAFVSNFGGSGFITTQCLRSGGTGTIYAGSVMKIRKLF